MENIIFSANIVLPLLLLMVVGYIARLFGLLDAKDVSKGNSIVFKIFMPCLLFQNIRNSEWSGERSLDILLFITIAVVVSFLLAIVFVMWGEKNNARRGTMIQGMARSNYALFGMPLLGLIFKNQDISLGAILIVIVIPIFNVSSVAILTYFGSEQADFRQVLIGVLKNPLIIGSVIGVLFAGFGIGLPDILDTTVSSLAAVATPYSLFILGAGFELKKVKSFLKPLIVVVMTRLVIFPVLFLAIAMILGFRGVELGCVMVVFGAPTAVSSYTMAEKMGCDGELASAIVVFTSTLCIFTFFIMIWGLKVLQVI